MIKITLSRKRFRTELMWLLGGFIAALVFKLSTLLRSETAWSEWITSLHVVILLALVLYILMLFLRGLVNLVIRFSAGNRKT